MQLTLPIYYTQEFKTKPSKTFLVSMNWYRGAFYHIQNEVKKHYHSLVQEQKPEGKFSTFHVDYSLYYKNPSCDASNVIALIEKFTLDALKDCDTIIDDKVKYHLSSSWAVLGQDKENPRVEITIKDAI